MGWKRKARSQGFRLHLSSMGPEAAANESAGVCMLTFVLQFCAAQPFAKAIELGRAYRIVLRIGRRAAGPPSPHHVSGQGVA